MTEHGGAGPPLAGLEEWYHSPLGFEVGVRGSACLQGMLGDVFGYYLVQVGIANGFREALAATRIRHRILLPCAPPREGLGLGVVGDPTRLPLASDAVDAVLLPHTLDFVADPRQVLREVERILIPEGRVFIVGFNALSSWGLVRLLRHRGRRVPWCGRFLTPYRVEDWLSLLGFDVEQREHILFQPPLRRALDPRLASLERLGRRLWPALGAVYVIRGVKRVSTLTPIKPLWSARRALLPGAIEPTTRRGCAGSVREAGSRRCADRVHDA
jgi:SAM-dependent methyltransferase